MLKAIAIFWLLTYVVMPVAADNGRSMETRVAVIETQVNAISQDIDGLQASIATKQELNQVNKTLSEIKALVQEKGQKIDEVNVWKQEHVKTHDKGDMGFVSYGGIYGMLAILAGFQIVPRVRQRRNGTANGK